MRTKKPNAERVWKEFEDHLAPRLGLCTIDRVVYSHLVRHSRLEGKLRLQFSLSWLAGGTDLSRPSVREALRRLIGHRVLRLVQRSQTGHVVEERIPNEAPPARPSPIPRRRLSPTLALAPACRPRYALSCRHPRPSLPSIGGPVLVGPPLLPR